MVYYFIGLLSALYNIPLKVKLPIKLDAEPPKGRLLAFL
jgi:hypothetical protein